MFNKIIKKIQKYDNLIAFFIATVFFLIYSFMSIRIHNQFQTFGWDLGVFDQGIWLLAKCKLPFSTFHDIWWFGDHIRLSLILLTPFYWLYENVRTLLVLQALLVCFGALPFYFLSKRLTKNSLFSLACLLNYLVFYPLQWHIFSGFHEFTLFPLLFGLLMLSWYKKNKFWYWLNFFLLVFLKEEIGFIMVAVGIWQLLEEKKRWRQALLTIFFGLIISFTLINFIIPLISGKGYLHADYGELGYSIIEVFWQLIRKPWLLVKAFFDEQIKIYTMFTTFLPWLFLPFLAPKTLVLPFEQFASRFLDYKRIVRWTPYYAYSLPMAAIMFWSSICGFKNLQKIIKKKKILNSTSILIPFLLVIVLLLEQILLHAPLNSLFKKRFYYNEPWIADVQKMLKCIPPNASVAAQNNLAPWLSQREKIKVLPDGIGYDYLIVDLHEGQSENNFRQPGRLGMIKLIDELIRNKEYQIICQSGAAEVLKKLEHRR